LEALRDTARAMSEENVHLVRGVYDALSRGDNTAVMAAYDPQIQLDFSDSPTASVLQTRIYRGYEGLRKGNREWHRELESVEYECDELIDAGDQVVCVVTTRGRGRKSRVESEMVHHGVWTIENAKIVRVQWLATREQALEAAGLSE
jgi:ketosteroid isomerase-like protein